MLDIGCGGGILSEPLARLGASVVGADPSDRNIAVAKEHAARSGLAIDYRNRRRRTIAEAGESFDVVLAMEVIEHVADVGLFIGAVAAMVKPGGLCIVATLNRTVKSFALAIVGAEYVCAGCRAAPINGTSSSPRTNSISRSRSTACASPPRPA